MDRLWSMTLPKLGVARANWHAPLKNQGLRESDEG
jgi:hypothetical protein